MHSPLSYLHRPFGDRRPQARSGAAGGPLLHARSLNASSRRLSRPVPPRLAGLVREAWWLALACGVGYLALALGSYDHADPGWSHAGPADRIANLGGRIGAWLADVLLYAFGLSAWWWVAFGAVALWWTFPPAAFP